MKSLFPVRVLAALAVLASGYLSFAQMSTTGADDPAMLSKRPAAEKIREAVSAGPPEISRNARVAEMAPEMKIIELRAGTNSWTCMPKQSATLPAMCVDPASMQWMMDFAQHKPKPTNLVPGITYMLAGATQRSDSDPYDKTSPLTPIGPHWVIMWPFDPKTTGLPTTHRATGAYIMWAGTPYAHVHVMGSPYGEAPQPAKPE
jgi:hypothetical protein